jgi:hypothetical protein
MKDQKELYDFLCLAVQNGEFQLGETFNSSEMSKVEVLIPNPIQTFFITVSFDPIEIEGFCSLHDYLAAIRTSTIRDISEALNYHFLTTNGVWNELSADYPDTVKHITGADRFGFKFLLEQVKHQIIYSVLDLTTEEQMVLDALIDETDLVICIPARLIQIMINANERWCIDNCDVVHDMFHKYKVYDAVIKKYDLYHLVHRS